MLRKHPATPRPGFCPPLAIGPSSTFAATVTTVASRRHRQPKRPRPCKTPPFSPSPSCLASPPDPPTLLPTPTPSSPLRTFVRTRLLADFDPSPELAAILTVYFIQGALGISRLAMTFFLKDDLHLGPAAVASLTALATLPWTLKMLYGICSDSLPLFGYRRRSYLILSGALGASSWAALGTFANTLPSVTAFYLLSSASVAIADVVADSLVVERVRGASAASSGALQSLCWTSCAAGGLLSAYLSGSLLEIFSARQVFLATSTLPLLIASLAGLVSETPSRLDSFAEFRAILNQRFRALWDALSDKSVYLPVAFVFCWQATPNPDSAMFFFNTNVLGFGPEFLGRVRLASAGASLLGLWAYRRWFRFMDMKTIFAGATLVGLPLALTQILLVTRANLALGIPDKLFAMTDTAVLAALGQVAFMPTLVLAARLCPPGVEGTLFAALMSVYNASGVTSNELGALLTKALGVTETNFDNLPLLVGLCGVSSLAALPLLGLIDEAPPAIEEGDYDGDVEAEGKGVGGMAVASVDADDKTT